MFLLTDNLIIIAVKSFELKIIQICICGYLLEILQAKVVHSGQRHVLRYKDLMLAEKNKQGRHNLCSTLSAFI